MSDIGNRSMIEQKHSSVSFSSEWLVSLDVVSFIFDRVSEVYIFFHGTLIIS